MSSNFSYMKVAAEGFAGSGKSYTLTQIAIGLHKAIQSTKPIKIFDTEVGSRFMVPIIKRARIAIDPQKDVIRGRSLTALTKLMDECDKGGADVLIIDSITHVWEEFLQTYKGNNGNRTLQFKDWGRIKPAWKKEFSDRVVLGQYNILFSGRAGYEYDTILDDGGRIADIVRSGIKMKAEGETAYEPDLLLLMERYEKVLNGTKEIYRTATVLKDRASLIDGKTFKNPTFNDFKPVWDFLTGEDFPEMPPESPDTDDGLVQIEESNHEANREKKIVLEEIEALFQKMKLGTGAADKKKKVDILYRIFMTASKTRIEGMSLEQLRDALDRMESDEEIQNIIKEADNGDGK